MAKNDGVHLTANMVTMAWEISGEAHSALGEIGLLVTTVMAAVAFFLPVGLAARRRRRQEKVDAVD